MHDVGVAVKRSEVEVVPCKKITIIYKDGRIILVAFIDIVRHIKYPILAEVMVEVWSVCANNNITDMVDVQWMSIDETTNEHK
jgi:hypothetical protein